MMESLNVCLVRSMQHQSSVHSGRFRRDECVYRMIENPTSAIELEKSFQLTDPRAADDYDKSHENTANMEGLTLNTSVNRVACSVVWL